MMKKLIYPEDEYINMYEIIGHSIKKFPIIRATKPYESQAGIVQYNVSSTKSKMRSYTEGKKSYQKDQRWQIKELNAVLAFFNIYIIYRGSTEAIQDIETVKLIEEIKNKHAEYFI